MIKQSITRQKAARAYNLSNQRAEMTRATLRDVLITSRELIETSRRSTNRFCVVDVCRRQILESTFGKHVAFRIAIVRSYIQMHNNAINRLLDS